MNLRTQKARQTYENILSIAEQLLKNCSYEDLSVEQICEYAKISKGGFYHHFSSKEHLISLLIGRQLGNLLVEQIEPYLDKKSAFELLNLYVNTTVEYIEANPRNMLTRCWLTLSENPEITNEIFANEIFRILHSIVAKGKAEGSIRKDLDNDFCQAFINSTTTGIVLYGSIFMNHDAIQDFSKNSVTLIWQTLS